MIPNTSETIVGDDLLFSVPVSMAAESMVAARVDVSGLLAIADRAPGADDVDLDSAGLLGLHWQVFDGRHDHSPDSRRSA